MEFALLAFCAVFLLLVSGGLLLFYREASIERVAEVIAPKSRSSSTSDMAKRVWIALGASVERLEGLLPQSNANTSLLTRKLARAGYRDTSAPKIFNGTKIALPLTMCAVVFVARLVGYRTPFFVYVLLCIVGFLAPELWLSRRITLRQRRVRRGLPNVLDLLVVCLEAGLSLDQSMARTSTELAGAQPDLCDEMNLVVLEQRAGHPRTEAWKNMAERTGEESLRMLTTVVTQAEQFGTSIGKTLREHAVTLRKQRIQQVEELAAKASVKLVFPLVFLILPALFVVVIGPSVIVMMQNFKVLLNH